MSLNKINSITLVDNGLILDIPSVTPLNLAPKDQLIIMVNGFLLE